VTGPQHYREAERLAEQAAGWMDADTSWKGQLSTEERLARRSADLAEAQVHATLALGPAPAAGVTLTPAQLRIVLDGLADAAAYRRICLSQFCGDCADSAPELCADHREADDESAIEAYEALSAELGGGAS
jgi:hypothetical protein